MLRMILLAGLLLSSLILVGPAAAQAPLQRQAAFEMMADPGRWIEVDGSFQKDGTFLAKEVEVISLADTSNMEEPQIYGAIQKIDRRRSTMLVLNYRIAWDKETTIKDAEKHRILSSKLEDGMSIKIQGHLRNNGVFWANKLKLKGEKIKDGKPAKAKEKLVGRVSILDERGGWVRILNTDILIRPDAKFVEVLPDLEDNAE
jgi:hypothetical protein